MQASACYANGSCGSVLRGGVKHMPRLRADALLDDVFLERMALWSPNPSSFWGHPVKLYDHEKGPALLANTATENQPGRKKEKRE